MKKKPNGFVSVLLALCLLLAPMTVFAESNAQLNYVTDDAGILTCLLYTSDAADD